MAQVDDIEAMALAWRLHAERLRAAICWVERPFADEATSDSELRQRIRFMLEDTLRSDAALLKALGASPASPAAVSDKSPGIPENETPRERAG